MPTTSLVEDFLTSADPNEPATNAAVLLLRAETKSEFRVLRSEIGAGFARVDERFGVIERSLELIAQQTLEILNRR